mgnify:CR=1 FL=1
MNICAHRFEPFLMTHAKMLFFIDDQQTQVIELDAFRQQCVGADHNIDGAAGHAFAGGICIFGGYETRQLPNLKREPTEPFGK